MGRRRASFDAFFEESHARLVSGLVLMTGDREVAAEAVAEAIARAWEQVRRGHEIENLEAWIRTVALNCARRTFRRRAPGGRWTDVHEGTYQLVVRNPDHLTRTFTVPGLAGRQHIAPNQSELTFTMTITARSDRKWGIEPTDQGYRNNGEGVLLWIQ